LAALFIVVRYAAFSEVKSFGISLKNTPCMATFADGYLCWPIGIGSDVPQYRIDRSRSLGGEVLVV
jgi:hypothetical protein